MQSGSNYYNYSQQDRSMDRQQQFNYGNQSNIPQQNINQIPKQSGNDEDLISFDFSDQIINFESGPFTGGRDESHQNNFVQPSTQQRSAHEVEQGQQGGHFIEQKLNKDEHQSLLRIKEEFPNRYFLLKKFKPEILELCYEHNIFLTEAANSKKLSDAFQRSENVYILFISIEQKKFFGYTRMIEDVTQAEHLTDDILNPLLEKNSEIRQYCVLHVEWVSKNVLNFEQAKHLKNPWNDNRPINFCKEGQEIEPGVAQELCKFIENPPDISQQTIDQQEYMQQQPYQRNFHQFNHATMHGMMIPPPYMLPFPFVDVHEQKRLKQKEKRDHKSKSSSRSRSYSRTSDRSKDSGKRKERNKSKSKSKSRSRSRKRNRDSKSRRRSRDHNRETRHRRRSRSRSREREREREKERDRDRDRVKSKERKRSDRRSRSRSRNRREKDRKKRSSISAENRSRRQEKKARRRSSSRSRGRHSNYKEQLEERGGHERVKKSKERNREKDRSKQRRQESRKEKEKFDERQRKSEENDNQMNKEFMEDEEYLEVYNKYTQQKGREAEEPEIDVENFSEDERQPKQQISREKSESENEVLRKIDLRDRITKRNVERPSITNRIIKKGG